MSTTPYQFIKRGNLFITPVGPSIAEVPYPTQTYTKPREFSLWINGHITEPAFQLDSVRMPPSMYQEVRKDLVRYSPVEVTRSAFQRSNHAYIGVIDSKGKPYYFALDSRGISVREVPINDEKVWKNFDRLADQERAMATERRRGAAAVEMRQFNRELSQPQLVIVKGGHTGTMVALNIPHDVAKEIALPGGEPPESMHVTVAYLGKNLTDEQKSGALVACRRIAQKCGPIKALLGGVGRFSASHTSEGKDVIYLSVDSPDLTRMRPMLIDELAIEGIVPSNAHGYVPHVTLAYVDTTARTPIKRFPPIAVEFPCLSLTVAEDKMLLPFTAPLVIKALPKKSKESEVKKTPNKKASKKQAGAGGKTRYTYPNEKLGAGGKSKQQPLLVVRHDDSKHADPAEFANQLGVSVRTLQRCAKKLGRDGFSKFMRTHLKRFSAKHRLDPDYWGTLYGKLQPEQEDLGKSDAAHLKTFAEHVKHVASSVPHDHEGRFGEHKVFISHAHSEMKKRGMHTGTKSEFKDKLVAAHRAGHLSLARADLVSAMPHHHVTASETNAHGASFHFISGVKHDTDHHREASVSTSAAHHSSAHAKAAGTKEAHMNAAIAHHRAGAAHQKLKDEKTANSHFKLSQKHLKQAK